MSLEKVRNLSETLKIVETQKTHIAQCAKKVLHLQKFFSESVGRRVGNSRGTAPAPTRQAAPKKVAVPSGIGARRETKDDVTINFGNGTPLPAQKGAKTKIPAANTKFVPPPAKDVAIFTNIIKDMHDSIGVLESAVALMKQSFSDNKKQPAAIKATQALIDEANKSLFEAYDMLHDLSEKHMPGELQAYVDKAIDHLSEVVDKKSYKSMSLETYCVAGKPGEFLFINYIGLKALRTTTGYTFDEYYVVVTGVINSKEWLFLHVTGLTDFRAPGTFPLGIELEDQRALNKRIDFLLAHNNFITEFEKLPIDDGAADQVARISGVKSVDVEDDTLVVTFASEAPATITKKTVEILGRLSALYPKHRAKFVPKTVGNVVRISLIKGPAGAGQMNSEAVRDLATTLDMSPDQVKALKFALTH